jgi:hypothetical protein
LSGSGPYSIISADLNNDGEIDLAVTNSGANTVTILFGNGNGTFENPIMYTVGELPVSLITGVFRHNNKLDLVIVDHLNDNICILLNSCP